MPAAPPAPVGTAGSRSRATRSSRSGTAASICSSETSAALTPPTCMVEGSIGNMTATVARRDVVVQGRQREDAGSRDVHRADA